jgi:hypothetical protein
MRWIALHLPLLSLESFAETPEAPEGQHANDLPALHRLLG